MLGSRRPSPRVDEPDAFPDRAPVPELELQAAVMGTETAFPVPTCRPPVAGDRGARGLMHVGVEYFVSVSAMVFGIGLFGVFTRRSPLILLLSVELMLNACNLALIPFARYHGTNDGQVFALVVMGVAASEVVVGLGLVVAVARRKAELDVDRMTALKN